MKAITVNGVIKIYSKIPTEWKRLATPNQLTLGYDTAFTNEEHEFDGWRDVVIPPYDPFIEKLTSVVYDTENDNYTYEIEELSEEEIAEYVQSSEDKDDDALALLKYKEDGIKNFDRAMALIMRRYRSGDITGSQAKNFSKQIYPEIEPLYKGQWQIVKAYLETATPPENDNLLDIFNLITTKVNEYVAENYG